ncbi:MAG: NAD(P)/FAD-dependent oxidoreductase [Acidimicrobiales bacterium]
MTDAVVIGSGPNGLVAANLLADHGWSVAVFEAASIPAAVRSAELVEPGFVNDGCSAFHPLAAASKAIASLDLEDHGLVWRHSPTVLAHPIRDGTCPVLSRDIDETAASLDQDHPGDGDAWRRLFARWSDHEDALLACILAPFPPVRGAVRFGTSMSPTDLARFARFALLPVRRLGEEEFGGAAARRLLAGSALHADLAPEATLSGFYGWMMTCLGQSFGFPCPEGGAGSLTRALVRRLEAKGGSVTCSAPIAQVLVRDGTAFGLRMADGTEVRADRAVLADVNAPMLYRTLVGSEHLPPGLLADLDRFHWDDATFKVDWTLDGPIPWTAPAAATAGTVHVAEGVDALTVSSSELARSLVPAEPFLLVGQMGVADPTRQPRGTETAWAYTHVPRSVKGDSGGEIKGTWDHDDGRRFADRMEAQIERLAPGFRDLIRGRHILTPAGFEDENPNLSSGAINGGTAQLHQQLVFRPVPGSGRPETPVSRLFLASNSAHPGGGVHGACGANAARAALASERRARVTHLVRRVVRRSPSRPALPSPTSGRVS